MPNEECSKRRFCVKGMNATASILWPPLWCCLLALMAALSTNASAQESPPQTSPQNTWGPEGEGVWEPGEPQFLQLMPALSGEVEKGSSLTIGCYRFYTCQPASKASFTPETGYLKVTTPWFVWGTCLPTTVDAACGECETKPPKVACRYSWQAPPGPKLGPSPPPPLPPPPPPPYDPRNNIVIVIPPWRTPPPPGLALPSKLEPDDDFVLTTKVGNANHSRNIKLDKDVSGSRSATERQGDTVLIQLWLNKLLPPNWKLELSHDGPGGRVDCESSQNANCSATITLPTNWGGIIVHGRALVYWPKDDPDTQKRGQLKAWYGSDIEVSLQPPQ
jgi:hypothetical protein